MGGSVSTTDSLATKRLPWIPGMQADSTVYNASADMFPNVGNGCTIDTYVPSNSSSSTTSSSSSTSGDIEDVDKAMQKAREKNTENKKKKV